MSDPIPAPPTSKRRRAARWLAVALLVLMAVGESFIPPRGGPFLSVEAPVAGQVVRPGGVDVLVRFASPSRVAPETFRCLLNGVDVTDALITGENGAAGRVHRLIDGENVLRLEVFGRPWWSGDSWVEEVREVRFRLKRRVDLLRG